ncbi:hypothetical protein [Pseudomonas synxantha]|uniref:hypothetical protein n=1 Tax=Pseudomonas synxantha TaxID=47883 RepID=UPI000AEAD77E|nr:hypothetical protein [Pseudomonas synxantha]
MNFYIDPKGKGENLTEDNPKARLETSLNTRVEWHVDSVVSLTLEQTIEDLMKGRTP